MLSWASRMSMHLVVRDASFVRHLSQDNPCVSRFSKHASQMFTILSGVHHVTRR